MPLFRTLAVVGVEDDGEDDEDTCKIYLGKELIVPYEIIQPETSEAKTIIEALKKAGGNPLLDDNIFNILAIRSKLHIKAVFKHIQEDIKANSSFIDAVECLTTPPTYFSKVLEAAMADGADENTREDLRRELGDEFFQEGEYDVAHIAGTTEMKEKLTEKCEHGLA